MDVAVGGPAGSAGGPAEGVPGAPLSSQALKGQRIFSPVFMVIFIHSTCHPIKRVKNHNWRKPTIASIWVTGGQLSRGRTSKQDPLLTTLVIRNHPHLNALPALHNCQGLMLQCTHPFGPCVDLPQDYQGLCHPLKSDNNLLHFHRAPAQPEPSYQHVPQRLSWWWWLSQMYLEE